MLTKAAANRFISNIYAATNFSEQRKHHCSDNFGAVKILAQADASWLWSGIVHMTELIPAQLGKFIRGISVRQVRLACGFVLFAYLVSYFVNHALGNISLGAMDKGIEYHKAFWQLLPVAIVFYSAAT